MSDQSLQQARVLIRQQRYAEARLILQQSSDPEAAEWLVLLQRLETAPQHIIASTIGLFLTLGAIIIGIIFAGISYFVFLRFLKRQNTPLVRK